MKVLVYLAVAGLLAWTGTEVAQYVWVFLAGMTWESYRSQPYKLY